MSGRRFRMGVVLASIALAGAAPAFGQDNSDVRSVSWWLDPLSKALHLSRDFVWTIVILANLAVLIWILYRFLFQGEGFSIPKALRYREQSIATRLVEAEGAHRAALERLAAAEASVANLPAELARLSAEMQAEAEREYERVLAEHRQESARLAERARMEMESAANLAQKQLKAYAAEMALELAERQIRARMNDAADREVIRRATEELARTGRPA